MNICQAEADCVPERYVHAQRYDKTLLQNLFVGELTEHLVCLAFHFPSSAFSFLSLDDHPLLSTIFAADNFINVLIDQKRKVYLEIPSLFTLVGFHLRAFLCYYRFVKIRSLVTHLEIIFGIEITYCHRFSFALKKVVQRLFILCYY